jgi:hypothetical protein
MIYANSHGVALWRELKDRLISSMILLAGRAVYRQKKICSRLMSVRPKPGAASAPEKNNRR